MIQYDVKTVFEFKKMNYLIYLPFLKTILWYRISSGWYQILLVLKLGVKYYSDVSNLELNGALNSPGKGDVRFL